MSRTLNQLCDTAPANALRLRLVSAADPLPHTAKALGFAASEKGTVAPMLSEDGTVTGFLVAAGDGSSNTLWDLAGISDALPAGVFVLENASAEQEHNIALGWGLNCYRFDRYQPQHGNKDAAVLVWPRSVDRAQIERLISAISLCRDLVNTPAHDMGPAELADAAQTLATAHGATLEVTVGEALLERSYTAIYTVGRGGGHGREPRLLDLRWGHENAPKVTLVGKGVCFDTGGLDIKGASGMRLMKKDMGGGAHALALAALVMDARLPVRLRVLVPAVENAISGDSYRPGDIIQTRKGLTVEVSNTDAEGRLVLADALTEACSEAPAVLVDFATLTGAARVALGPELPALFSNDDALANELLAAGRAQCDPLWRMPLWAPYRSMLDSPVADVDNAPEGGMAGAILAALFLERFVDASVPWAHIDLYAWNRSTRPGQPKGGEAMALRAVFEVLKTRFSSPR